MADPCERCGSPACTAIMFGPLDARDIVACRERELSALRAEHEAVLELLDWVGDDLHRSVWRCGVFCANDESAESSHSAETAVELLVLLKGKAGGQ